MPGFFARFTLSAVSRSIIRAIVRFRYPSP
jgi:hypothetical protein